MLAYDFPEAFRRAEPTGTGDPGCRLVRNASDHLLPFEGPHINWAQRRRLEGLDAAQRLRTIAEQLKRSSSIAVRDSHAGVFGDRWTIWLDDNTLLKLKLFWVVKDNLAASIALSLLAVLFGAQQPRLTRGESVPGLPDVSKFRTKRC